MSVRMAWRAFRPWANVASAAEALRSYPHQVFFFRRQPLDHRGNPAPSRLSSRARARILKKRFEELSDELSDAADSAPAFPPTIPPSSLSSPQAARGSKSVRAFFKVLAGIVAVPGAIVGILAGVATCVVIASAPAMLLMQALGFGWVLGIPVTAVIAVSIFFIWMRLIPPRPDAELLTAGHCAACGYRMAGLEVQSDGCTLCPECGAAWRPHHLPLNPYCDNCGESLIGVAVNEDGGVVCPSCVTVHALQPADDDGH